MMVYRPALVIAASALTFVACTGNDPDNSTNEMTAGTTDGSTTGVDGAGGGAVGSGGSGGPAGAGGGTVGSGGSAGGVGSGGGSAGGDGSGGAASGTIEDGPCDVAGDAGHECVAAYSLIRRIQSDYEGPLYQLRVGSSEYNIGGERVTNVEEAVDKTNGSLVIPYQTTPEPGMLVDVPQTASGFADDSIFTSNCPIGTTCTVSLIYDQSGKGNDLPVAKGGLHNGGDFAGLDDFETVMNSKAALKVGGHDVHSLYMDSRQGYRLTSPGTDVPLGTEAEGMYMLADGTHAGGACCWDFGNVTPDPASYAEMNTLFLGTGYWGKGNGQPPWYGADFEAGVWMGGSSPSDPGWGGLSDSNPNGNPNSPSMRDAQFAIGFLKTNSNAPNYTYALSMADLKDASLTLAYEGDYPKDHPPGHKGAIVIGVGGDNSNNSFGTFYEGAVYKGYPDAAVEQAIMDNIKTVGYGQ